MTVTELINELRKLPGDMEACIPRGSDSLANSQVTMVGLGKRYSMDEPGTKVVVVMR